MAIDKLAMKRGTFFKGYQMTVATAAGDYVLNIPMTKDMYVNSMEFLNDDSGAGDLITIGHYESSAADAILVSSIAETLYNPGPGRPYKMEFPALEHLQEGHDLRVTYTNAGSVPIDHHTYVEFIK